MKQRHLCNWLTNWSPLWRPRRLGAQLLRAIAGLSLAAVLSGMAGAAEVKPAELPRVFQLDPQKLAQTKQRLARHAPSLADALERLRRDADKALKDKPASVMDKAKMPPSQDKHDYMSLATYYWPDPAKPGGLPYLKRDGEVNPEIKSIPDHEGLGQTCTRVETLGLAYYFTGQEAYAEKAAGFLKVWFLDPATRMNPNLNYAQAVPGRNSGRGIGIIDTVALIRLVDGVGLLAGSRAWTPELQRGMQDWFRAYLQWLLTSKNGRDEAKAANNHGSWYQAQTTAYALFIGDLATARKQAEGGRERLASQIEPDGRQPLELARTKSYGYTLYNLEALFTLAELARRVEVDLFNYRTADGRSLQAALDYTLPYFPKSQGWPDKQIQPIKEPDEKLAGLLRRAALVWQAPRYEAALAKAASALTASRFQLLWPEQP